MRLPSLLAAGLFALSLLAPAIASSQTSAGASPAYSTDPRYKTAMDEGALLMKNHRYNFAVDSFKKACKLAGEHSLACLDQLNHAQLANRDFKGAAGSALAMEALAQDPSTKSIAAYRQADALYLSAGDKPRPDKLQAVHALLQQSLTAYPRNVAALFLDGKVLAGLGQTDEARADFSNCAKCLPSDSAGRLRAEHFADNPALSLQKAAPAFEVTALDGSRFNLDAMSGKVVLIDFWATWCGPCNRELPHMKQIAREFAGQPLVILSVSWDSDEAKWKEFVQKNEMTWPQYRDADHKLSDMFGINAIPHYFTIDSDGVLTAEMLGEGSNVEGKLKKLIAKANAAHPQTAMAIVPAQAGPAN